MMRRCSIALFLLLIVVVPVVLLGAGSSRGADDGNGPGAVKFLAATAVPPTAANTTSPGKMIVFDISFVDQDTQQYFLADRSNVVVDVVDARTGNFVRQISAGFKGFTGKNDTSGPNGVVVIGRPGRKFLIVTDAPSRVVSINLQTNPPSIVNEVSTGGAAGNRADELAFDPEDNLLLPVNNADSPPFATLIRVDPATGMLTQPANVEGVDRITFTDATNGAEQPAWDPHTRRFYISIPEVNGPGGTGPDGAVKRINPHTATVEKTFAVEHCQPAGLTLGPAQDLLLGCSVIFNANGTAWTGLDDPFTAAPIQVVMDAKNGDVDAMVAGVGGSDEVWFNRGDGRYYTASRANPGAVPNGFLPGTTTPAPETDPVLGVIDAQSRTLLQLAPTFNTPNGFPQSSPPRGTSHSVAVNAHNNHVFVPLPANNVFPNCQTGCIAIYGRE